MALSTPSVSTVYSRAGYILLAVVLLLGVVHSARQGVASAWHFKSLYFLDNWSVGERHSTAAYQEALQAAHSARQGDMQNPHYALMLARILEWGYLKQWDEQTDLALLRTLYVDAIAKRPSWTDAYAGYAYASAYILNEPEQVYPLLLSSHQHGPYMPTQLMQSVFIISDFWQQMPAEAKQFYFARVRDVARAPAQTFNPVSAHLRQHPLREVTCAYLSVTPLSEAEQSRLKRTFCR